MAHGIPCSHFYFLFRNNFVSEQLDENDFRRSYGNFYFESVIPKVLDHRYTQSPFLTITRHFDNGI